MAFLVKAAPFLLGALVGSSGKKKAKETPPQPPLVPRPATRDEAEAEAERERELERRRGPAADRIVSGTSVPAGGLGRLIVGS